jgi:hypothetical protein
MALIANMATFIVNGASFTTDGDFQLTIKGVKRTPIPASDGSIHYSEEIVPDTITGNMLMVPGFNPAVITALSNATIQLQLGGKAIGLLESAFFSGDAGVGSKSGAMAVEFSGRGTWLT